MRIFYILLIVVPIAIALSQSSGSSSATAYLTFSGTPQSAQFSQSASQPYALSPAKPVYEYNNADALYLITCPNAPSSSPSSPQLFSTTGSQVFGAWYLAGNECQAPSSSSTYPVSVKITDTVTSPPPQSLPTSYSSSVNVMLTGATHLSLSNIGFSPELVTPTGNFISTDFNTDTYIFHLVPVNGQQGIWTWYGMYAQLSQLDSKLPITAYANTQGVYDYNAICEYTYSLYSSATLESIKNYDMPFSGAQSATINIGMLPYFVYNANVVNPMPSNEFNYQISYDIYSPQNYYAPKGVVEPFGINSISLFLTGYNGNLSYMNNKNQLQITLSSADSNIGLLMPLIPSSSTTTPSSGQCPNQYYTPSYSPSGPGHQLTLSQVIACASNAGFTGGELVTIVSMAFQESSFQPGDMEAVYCAAGILQEGHGNCPYPESTSFISGYSPLTCSTYAQYGWAGVYFNPTCAFQWAHAEVNDQGFYPFWGSYETGAYCKYAPNGFTGVTDPAGGITVPCSGVDQNQIPSYLGSWTSSGYVYSMPSNSASGITAHISTFAQSGTTGTTGQDTYSITINPNSITADPNGYIFVLGTNPNAGKAGSGPSPGASSCNQNQICAEALTQLGVPYCYGAESPRGSDPLIYTDFCSPYGTGGIVTGRSGGFDCSGLVDWATSEAGLPVFGTYSPGTHGLATTGEFTSSSVIHITQAEALPGDLVFFNVPGESPQPSHVGICYNVGCTEMIAAPQTGYTVYIGSVSGVCGISCIAGYVRVKGSNGAAASPYQGYATQPSNEIGLSAAEFNQTTSQNVFAVAPPPPSSSTAVTPEQQYLSEISTSGTAIFVLKAIPPGYYNATLYQPNDVPNATDPSTFATNWNQYWSNLQILQSQSLYVVNVISITKLLASSPSTQGLDFSPINISSDSFGDIYITGEASAQSHTVGRFSTVVNSYSPWLVKITNTLGNGPIEVSAAPLCPSGQSSVPSEICPRAWPEIAVSPTGSQVYIANSSSGYIPIYNGGTLAYSTYISLDFNNDQALYTSLLSGPSEGVAANIIDYFQNGGLYNITTDCGGSGQPACTSDDNKMKDIINTYKSTQSYSQVKDQLDQVDWPSGNSNNNYHHPLGIEDINGYLYVLDDWAGTTGLSCNFNIGGLCAPLTNTGGILFNILDLRVINSSGVDVPIVPTYYNDLWYYTNSDQYSLKKFTANSNNLYPPFGWILSANVSAMKVTSFGLFAGPQPPFISLCSGDASQCSNPPSNYYGTLLPIGPPLKAYGTCNFLGVGQSAIWASDVAFSVNYNNTASIYIPSSANIQNPGCSSNKNSELILAHLNPQNYTKQIGTASPIPFQNGLNYKCYTGDSQMSSSATSQAECSYDPNTPKLSGPIYLASNPFEFDSNFGGYQVLALDAIYGSAFSGGSGPSSQIGSGGSLSGYSNSILNGLSGTVKGISGTSFTNLNSLQNFQQSYATSLNSVITGYAVLPFSYTYQLSWYISDISPVGPLACDNIPSSVSNLEGPQTSTQTIYASTASNQQQSGNQEASIEGGPSYARSGLNTTEYYNASLYSIIIPSHILYNIINSRLFGKTYVNSTINAKTNEQEIVNATTLYTYASNMFSQGALPGYEIFTQQPLSPACSGVKCAAPLANVNKAYLVKNLFSTVPSNPSLITLFNFFRLPVDNLAISLQMNGTLPGSSDIAYGYHRLVFVYNDRFNNTVYMPLDADIANLTEIALNVTPDVNSINVNQTTIVINGTAFWTVPLTTNTVPLRGGDIYLYYDTNLDSIGYNAVDQKYPTDIAAATLCAFTSDHTGACQYANPVWTGLQYNSSLPEAISGTRCIGQGCFLNNGLYPDGTPYISANVITYKPSFNSHGYCSPPANSLLQPINAIYTMCNIYASAAANANIDNTCPASPQGNTQYCYPLYHNGTGICTSQLGLIGIYPTNSMGYFNANIVACGSASATIIAQYFGTPAPEPISASQSALPYSADPSSSQYLSFKTVNYSWTPVQVSEPVQTGSLLLSLGSIKYLPVLVLAIGAAIILYGAKKSSGRRQRRRSMRNNRI